MKSIVFMKGGKRIAVAVGLALTTLLAMAA